MELNIHNLIDDDKCFEAVRNWLCCMNQNLNVLFNFCQKSGNFLVAGMPSFVMILRILAATLLSVF